MTRRVGFDLRPLQEGFKAHKHRGIGVYARSLIQRRPLAPDGVELVPFHDPRYESAEPAAHGSRPFTVGPLARMAGPYLKEYYRQHLLLRRDLDAWARREKLDLLFFATHLDVPAGLSTPYAASAMDMIQAALAERHYATFKQRLHLKKQIAALRGAARIVAISEHTKQDVVRHAGVDPERIFVVPLAADASFTPDGPEDGPLLARFNLPERYLFNVGGIDWRKNVEFLVEAFHRAAGADRSLHLVMAGKIDDDPRYPWFAETLHAHGIADRVRLIGYVSAAELAALYRKARLVLYPSVYEGFGLPVAEAMACGAPVVSTDRSSIPEVAGEAALLVDPDDPAGGIEAMCRLLADEGERERLRQAGLARAALFSWDRTAREVYRLVAETPLP